MQARPAALFALNLFFTTLTVAYGALALGLWGESDRELVRDHAKEEERAKGEERAPSGAAAGLLGGVLLGGLVQAQILTISHRPQEHFGGFAAVSLVSAAVACALLLTLADTERVRALPSRDKGLLVYLACALATCACAQIFLAAKWRVSSPRDKTPQKEEEEEEPLFL